MLNFKSTTHNRISAAARAMALAAVISLFSGCTQINEDILPEADEGAAIIIITSSGDFNNDNNDTFDNSQNSDDAMNSDNITNFSHVKNFDYVKSSLTDIEREAYDAIVNGVISYEPYVKLPAVMTAEQISKLFNLVYSQESKIFWLSNIFHNTSEPSDTINLNYRYSKEKSDTMRGELELAVGTILGELPSSCTAYQAVKYFHDTIVTGCTFSKDYEHVNSAYGALVDGHSQCEGYAFAMSLLCDRSGIENVVVTGTNSLGATHAWNKVNIDGEWYNIDCTWDDPIIKYENPLFLKHDYLLLCDKDILDITHFQNTDYFIPPVCSSEKANYFIMENLAFYNTDDGINSLREQMKKQALAGKREIEVRFMSYDIYQTAMQRLFDENEIRTIINDINGKNGSGIKSAYKYNNDDLFIIHLSLIYEKDN